MIVEESVIDWFCSCLLYPILNDSFIIWALFHISDGDNGIFHMECGKINWMSFLFQVLVRQICQNHLEAKNVKNYVYFYRICARCHWASGVLFDKVCLIVKLQRYGWIPSWKNLTWNVTTRVLAWKSVDTNSTTWSRSLKSKRPEQLSAEIGIGLRRYRILFVMILWISSLLSNILILVCVCTVFFDMFLFSENYLKNSSFLWKLSFIKLRWKHRDRRVLQSVATTGAT